MQAMRFSIANKTSKTMNFHLEPECWPFSLPVGGTALIRGEYANESPSIQFSESETGEIFGALFPGDGSVVVEGEHGKIIAPDDIHEHRVVH
jgi:hypothetical protein